MNTDSSIPPIVETQSVVSGEFFAEVIHSLEEYAVFTLDIDQKINTWNSGAAAIFKYSAEEVMGKSCEMLFTKEDITAGIPQKEIVLASIEGKAMVNRWHIAKGEIKFFAHGFVFPLTAANGKKLGYVKVVQDITEKRMADDVLRKAIKDLEELNNHKESVLAILSHDLRSPLAAVIITASYLKSNIERMDSHKVREMLELLHSSLNDELNMLDYLVDWARIKYAAEAFSPGKLNLADYVDKVFETLKDTAQFNGINLLTDIEKSMYVYADPNMLISVLQNIIANAIRYTHPGGNISVTAKRKDSKMLIEVKDTGIGMSKEIQKLLFTPQISSLTKERNGGKKNRIGLLLVKGFLEKNGGEIWVESTEGVGSSFYFTLPIDKPMISFSNHHDIGI